MTDVRQQVVMRDGEARSSYHVEVNRLTSPPQSVSFTILELTVPSLQLQQISLRSAPCSDHICYQTELTSLVLLSDLVRRWPRLASAAAEGRLNVTSRDSTSI